MKKNTKNLNLKRGISLIVLVITIIVIVILAVAVILSIANNNPIENAKTAKELHNQATLEEAANLAYTTMYTNAKINGEEIDYAEMTKDIQKNLNEQGFSKDEVKKVKATKDGIQIKERYTLKAVGDFNTDSPFFGMYYRDSISKVIFEDSTVNAPENANDLSEEGNGSILGWQDEEKQSEIHIASDGIICAQKDCSGLFSSFISCREIQNLNLLDTSNVTNMRRMFGGDSSLTELDLSNFDTSNVIDMSWMFDGCNYLSKLDLSSFDTSNVTNMSKMFGECIYLAELDLSSFDTSNVTDMSRMFGCYSELTELDLSNFDTSNVTDMSCMFASCKKLNKIYINSDKFKTDKVEESERMFEHCDALVGGAGTVYDANYMDKTYARIDGGPDSATPGYFTLKQ